MDEQYVTNKLNYSIYKYSSYSANYLPENIMVNNPPDQLSRWFTDSTTPLQFIMLKLQSPSIVESIKFGKYIKAHVSDLKKFQIFGGTDENNLSLLLTAGLKKDCLAETFKLRHRTSDGLYLPVRYIKIVPLQSWGPAYNYTIWYVELQGKNHEDLITSAMDTINLRKEEEAVRILLKHLRRRRYKDAFEALSRESGVQLEGAVQARLWNALVENGDYKLAEQIFDEAANDGELDWYMSWQPYSPEWRQLCGCSAEVEERLCCDDAAPQPLRPRGRPADLSCADRDPRQDLNEGGMNGAESAESCDSACGSCGSRPGPRGGHQLVVDPNSGTLYLFGGWNGTEDLDDLWSFDTTNERWTLLCRHSGMVGGPSPRSCHKMVFDPVHERLYTLGRYLDNAQRVPSNMNSDLYSYEVSAGEWALVSGDTAAAGGPRLVFDHQMCLDADTQTLYVFGGRVLPANTEELASPQYSGLYAYYISRNTWQLLLADKHELAAPQPRVSHSMLFHPVQRRLYMFAGQRNKEQLVDLWWWECEAQTAHALCAAPARAPPPQGFTQRATLDPDCDEIHVLSGMSKEKDKRVYNTLWVFSLRRRAWTCVYRNDSVAPAEPRPRFAHQLVYDPVRKNRKANEHTGYYIITAAHDLNRGLPTFKIHYLFGGNPGTAANPRLRLDDLWSLRLRRAPAHRALAGARAALREAHYRELAATPRRAAGALHYLRHELRDVTDHDDPLQVEHFQKLATVLFAGTDKPESSARALSARRVRALTRRRAALRREAHSGDMAQALAAVLGADDALFEPTQPFEESSSPTPDTWDVGTDEDDAPDDAEWDERAHRMRLYDQLCRYFRPSTVPPHADVTDLVNL